MQAVFNVKWIYRAIRSLNVFENIAK